MQRADAKSFYLFNVFVLLIILCCLVCAVLIATQDDGSSRKSRKIFVLDKLNEWEFGAGGRKQRLPQAIIIGAKKCGTAALLEFINIHPMVRVCHREIHFFDNNETYVKGYDWYRDQMPATHPGQITIEKSPKYFVSKSAALRIREMNSNTKLVLIVRDPVVRAISDYVHIQYSRQIKLPQFEKLALASGKVNETWRPIFIGKYAQHFSRWLKYFPRNQILVLSGEKIITDPTPEVQKLETFLGLENLISKDHFVFNQSKGFICHKSYDKQRTECLHQAKGREHPTVDPEVLQKLKDFYEPYNQKFFDLAGEDFGWNSKVIR